MKIARKKEITFYNYIITENSNYLINVFEISTSLLPIINIMTCKNLSIRSRNCSYKGND